MKTGFDFVISIWSWNFVAVFSYLSVSIFLPAHFGEQRWKNLCSRSPLQSTHKKIGQLECNTPELIEVFVTSKNVDTDVSIDPAKFMFLTKRPSLMPFSIAISLICQRLNSLLHPGYCWNLCELPNEKMCCFHRPDDPEFERFESTFRSDLLTICGLDSFKVICCYYVLTVYSTVGFGKLLVY